MTEVKKLEYVSPEIEPKSAEEIRALLEKRLNIKLDSDSINSKMKVFLFSIFEGQLGRIRSNLSNLLMFGRLSQNDREFMLMLTRKLNRVKGSFIEERDSLDPDYLLRIDELESDAEEIVHFIYNRIQEGVTYKLVDDIAQSVDTIVS